MKGWVSSLIVGIKNKYSDDEFCKKINEKQNITNKFAYKQIRKCFWIFDRQNIYFWQQTLFEFPKLSESRNAKFGEQKRVILLIFDSNSHHSHMSETFCPKFDLCLFPLWIFWRNSSRLCSHIFGDKKTPKIVEYNIYENLLQKNLLIF